MKRSEKYLALAVMAGIASANIGTAFADADEYERTSDYGTADTLKRGDSDRGFAGRRGGYALLKQYGVDSRDHWKVTDAVYDDQGRLSMLQHVVPLHDMAVFGSVTTGIVANDLKLERVDAVFNAPDSDVREPHYHFTQRFQASY